MSAVRTTGVAGLGPARRSAPAARGATAGGEAPVRGAAAGGEALARGAVARAVVTLAAAVAFALGAQPAAAADELAWRGPILPDPVAGVTHSGPLGRTGAPAFVAPNRAVLPVEGSAGVPKGLYRWDGKTWSPMATVCGGNAERSVVAWASPRELWVVADPVADPSQTPPDRIRPQVTALPRDEGTTLCRLRDGRVIASYGVPPEDPNRWNPMAAATCRSATDCWFAGNAAANPAGQGTFQLHWEEGGEPRIVWGPQGRGMTALETFEGELWGTTVHGRRPDRREDPLLATPEPGADMRLLRQFDDSGDGSDPLRLKTRPRPLPGCAGDACAATPDDELRALDAGDALLWAVGGGSTSESSFGRTWGQLVPPSVNDSGGYINPRFPLAAVYDREDGWRELRFDPEQERAAFAPDDHFVSVAAIPGRPYEAWVGVERHETLSLFQVAYAELLIERLRYSAANPQLARIAFDPEAGPNEPNAEVLEVVRPPQAVGTGSAKHVACPAPDDCWLVTSEGWFFRWSDGSSTAPDPDPPFPALITVRPGDARTRQGAADTTPVDDSLRFAPPPPALLSLPPAPAPPVTTGPPPRPLRLPALLHRVELDRLGRSRARLTFSLRRPARVAVVLLRGGRAIGRTAPVRRQPGDHAVTLRVDPRKPFKNVRFAVEELAATAPTLGATASRSAAALRVGVRLPAAGRLRIGVAEGTAGRVVADRSRALRAGRRTVTVPIPPRSRGRALTVRLRYAAAAGTGAEPAELSWQLRSEPEDRTR